ncbi:MAG: D-alanyl-D-alanine carboxypeptidase, partial [Acidimicrobiales bacterium]
MRPRAEGRRRSDNPLRLVLAVGLSGSMLLGGLWVWLDGLGSRAQALETTLEPPAARRPVLSVRRTPDVLSLVTRTTRVTSRVDELLSVLPDGSCLTVRWLGTGMANVNPDTQLVPGSVMKLVTAAAALAALGADRTFPTSV